MATIFVIARKILGEKQFIEYLGKENLPNLKIRIELRHHCYRKQFERIFFLSDSVQFEGYKHNNLSYPSYIIDRFFQEQAIVYGAAVSYSRTYDKCIPFIIIFDFSI